MMAMGFRKPRDWLQISCKDIIAHCGSSLFRKFSSLYDLTREFIPKLDWDCVDRQRKITEKEILKWADAYRAKHGKWPHANSGIIPGINYNWQAIIEALADIASGCAINRALLALKKRQEIKYDNSMAPLIRLADSNA
jgi:hypothetical protein